MNIQTPTIKVGSLIGEDKGESIRQGIFKSNGKLYASRFGTLVKRTQTVNGKEVTTLNVEGREDGNRSSGLSVGDELVCRIVRIREDGAWVQVLQVNDVRSNSLIQGFIRRELIREKEIDKIRVQECFLPGDIVRAKFVSFGDGRRIYISTAGEDLGVVYAKSQASGNLMLPFSWTEMVCLKTGVKEYRKVAKPNQR